MTASMTRIGPLRFALMPDLFQAETNTVGLHVEVWTPPLKVFLWDWGMERREGERREVTLWLGPFMVIAWREPPK